MRLAAILPLTLLLGACAGESTRGCASLAGPAWRSMPAPPANAGALLATEGLPNDPDAVWFSAAGGQKLLACIYSRSLTNPGCSGASAYQFEQADGHWV